MRDSYAFQYFRDWEINIVHELEGRIIQRVERHGHAL